MLDLLAPFIIALTTIALIYRLRTPRYKVLRKQGNTYVMKKY